MHDYQPSWDYPVLDLQELTDLADADRELASTCIDDARRDILPALGFSDFEVFFVEPLGLTSFAHDRDVVLAIYCNGTSSRPVIGLDLCTLKRECEQEDLDFGTQIRACIGHELGHAFQESVGLDHDHAHGFDEDEAEAFGRRWALDGQVSVEVLTQSPQQRPRRR